MIDIPKGEIADPNRTEEELIQQQVIDATEGGVGGLDVVKMDDELCVIRWSGDRPTYDPLSDDGELVDRYICNADEVTMPEIDD